MAEAALLGFFTDELLGKAFSLAADEISLIFGVKEELEKLAGKLKLVQALLSDAQTKRLDGEVVKLLLENLKSIARDAEIVLDDYGYEVLRQKNQRRKRDKVRSFISSSNPLYFGSRMGHKIRGVLTSLDKVCVESSQIVLQAADRISSPPDLNNEIRTNSIVDESEIVGRDEDASKVIRMLIGPDYKKEVMPVITILGMAGQGKTTLAQVVYNDVKVGSYFNKKVWVYVSDDFNVGRILAKMLESLTQTNCQLTNTEALVIKLKEQLRGKRFLVVLDDVWNENTVEWNDMRTCLREIGGSKGSKVMATTRSERVADAMQTSGYYRLQILSEDQSLDLFERCAFAKGGATRSPELVDLAKNILRKCGGVPLAIKAVGGLLYSRDSVFEWSMIEESDLWSTEGSEVLPAIKFSYDHLLSLSLKQCFAYCATFPKDTELESDTLVQHWMAQGFLNPPKGSPLQMEDVGNMHLKVLLKSSLLQDFKKNKDNAEYTCKMHGIVHYFASQVLETYCADTTKGKVVSFPAGAVHLQVTDDDRELLPRSFRENIPPKLRTLHLCLSYESNGWFGKFRCLTILTITNVRLEKLPKAIGKITHLRFLDICDTKVHTLPKSFGRLYYLETLKCSYLRKLPVGFMNLTNLRHLCIKNQGANYVIPYLSRMSSIQTIPFFKVGKSKGCQIEELEHLDNLRGRLSISGLENVRGYKSASRSKLSNKLGIHTLELVWEKWEHDCDATKVMEGLKPHSNVKILGIDGYQSRCFPSWIEQLCHLTRITLKNLDNCEKLPSLGQMHGLEVLEMRSLPNLKCIGKEFYGNRERIDTTLFPALKSLTLSDMRSLEEWSDALGKAFPCLEIMVIDRFPKLSVFPNLGSLPCLGELHIVRCPNLDSPTNWNSPTPWVKEIFRPSKNPKIHYLSYLHSLTIIDCDKLVAPFFSLNTLASLKMLCITGNASFWPKNLQNLHNLESLDLSGGDYSEEIGSFPFPYPNSTARRYSLTSLSLHGWSKITSLPDHIQHQKKLRKLHIHSFDGLEALPDWLCNLKCLEDLRVYSCKNMKQFLSTEALQCLPNLIRVEVIDCPLLQKVC